jgi:hypothetical protein
MGKRLSPGEQRERRQRRGERAFLLALWGRSAEEARGTYRQWQKRRGGK